MEIVFHVARHTWRWSIRLSWLALLGLLMMIALAWVLLPQAKYLHDNLATALSEHLQAPVAIQELAGRWRGIYPSVEIRGFTILHPQHGQALLRFQRAEATLDLPASLWQRRPVLRELTLHGGQLALLREQGVWRLLPNAGVDQPDEPVDLALLSHLLTRLQGLSLNLDRVSLIHDPTQAPLELRHLHLDLLGEGTQQTFALRFDPPGAVAPSPVELRLSRHLAEPNKLHFTLLGRRLDLAPYEGLLGPLRGQLNVTLEGRWHQGLTDLEGGLHIYQPRLAGTEPFTTPALALDSLTRLEAQLHWERHPEGWQASAYLSGYPGSGQPLWESELFAQRPQAGAAIQATVDHLPVALVISLLHPWVDLPAQLPRLNPGGYLNNTHFLLGATPETLEIHSQFDDLSIRPQSAIPHIDGLDGTLHWSPQGGQIDLTSHFLRIRGQPLAAPVEASLSGSLAWEHHSDTTAITLQTLQLDNTDLRVTLSGGITLEAVSPRLDLRLAIAHLALDRIVRYLPVTLMKPRLVNWLRQALVAGQVRDGTGILQGRLADFPFADTTGRAELHLPVEQLSLDYAPPWPRLRQGRGELRLQERELHLAIQEGKILDALVQQASAQQILGQPPMLINVNTQGPAESFLAAVQMGKAPAHVKQQLANLKIQGDPHVNVAVRLPFQQRPPQVSGEIAFNGSQVRLPQYGLNFENLQGNLQFGPEGLQAEGLQLRLHDRPATLEIDSQVQDSGKAHSRFRLVGEPDPQRLAPALGNVISGRSRWQAELYPQDPGHFRLRLTSDLRGSQLQLPAPLGKPLGTPRQLQLDAQVSPSHLDLALHLEPGLRGQLRWSQPGLRIERGELRLNAGAASLPDTPGLALIAHLPNWQSDTGAGATLPSELPPWLHSLDLGIANFQLGQLHLPEFRLQLKQHRPGQLQGQLSGPNAAGEVRIPVDRQTPLWARLQRLRLPSMGNTLANDTVSTTTTAHLSPQALPPLDLAVEQLEIAGESWGRLQLQTRSNTHGLTVEPLQLSSQNLRLSGSANWQRDTAGETSRLELSLQSDSLGETLSKLGLNTEISGATTSARLALRWPGALWQPQLPSVQGRLELDIANGRFLSLEPGGFGRLLGLVSLQGLERRLSLDFSDVNQQGLGFDSIQGQVELDQGIAHIPQLLLSSPATQVSLEGQVDLLNQTLDQTLSVVPRIGTSVGLASTLVAGPVVGAAVLAADALLPGGVGRATRLAYHLSGPWQQPTIEPIHLQRPQQSTDPVTGISNR